MKRSEIMFLSSPCVHVLLDDNERVMVLIMEPKELFYVREIWRRGPRPSLVRRLKRHRERMAQLGRLVDEQLAKMTLPPTLVIQVRESTAVKQRVHKELLNLFKNKVLCL